MSLPREEARALEEARQFLLDLSSGAEKRIPTVTRQRARRIVRHYPLAPSLGWLKEDR